MKTISIYDNRLEIEAFIKTLNPFENDFESLFNSRTQAEWVGRLFMNYKWIKAGGLVITEIEEITQIQYSKFYVWLLENYCLGKDVDDVVQEVIDLHKKIIAGEEVLGKDWSAARDAAWYAAGCSAAWYAWFAANAAAWSAAGDAAWSAKLAAGSAGYAASATALATITIKIGEIILEN